MGESLIISIIICTKNRGRDLSITLESICLQKYKPNYIIIVDDSNNSETRKVIDEYSDIIYFHPSSPHSGLPAARNAGLKYVPPETEIVLFLDDDVTLDENYLFEMVKGFEDKYVFGATGNLQTKYLNFSTWKKLILAGVGFVVPPLVPISIYNSCVKKSGVATTPIFDLGEYKTSVEWLSGCNMAYRNDIFKQGARFDEALVGYAMGEDMLFSHKLYLSGKQICRINTALLEHRCSEENRSDDLKKIIMTLAYRRYIIENITNDKRLSNLYYFWFSNMFLLSAHILCAVGKRDKEYLSDCFTAKEYVSGEPNITKINRFLRGE